MRARMFFAAAVALALLLGAAGGAWYALRGRPPAFCEIDDRPIHANMHTLVRVDGEQLHACCPRCPLTLMSQEHLRVEILGVTDYVSGQQLPADQAYFVEGSRVEVCSTPRLSREEGITPYARLFDRCAPSLLAFAREDQARAFLAEHGGSLKRLDELMREAAAQAPSRGESQHD